MNIVFEWGFTPPSFENGLHSVFKMLGHTFIGYSPSKTATFDVFDKYSPNLYVGSITRQPNAVKKCLSEFSCKFYAIEAIAPAADVVSRKAGKVDSRYESDVVYVGGFEESLKEYIDLAANHFKLKIFQGSEPGSRWGIKNELGLVNNKTMGDVYASAKCSLAFADQYKFYDILLSGGFPLADKSILGKYPYAFGFTSPESMFWELNYIVNDMATQKVQLVKRQMVEEVLRNHTYFHRVFDLFNDIKKPKEATKTLDFYYANFPIRK